MVGAASIAGLMDLAERQCATFRLDQAEALGCSRQTLHDEVQRGRLRQPHPEVFTVAGHPETARQQAMAAVLACGDEARLSFHSAVALFGLALEWPTTVHVTLPHALRVRRLRGVRLHRSRRLEAEDRGVVEGIPVTSVERTLIDVVPECTRARSTMLVDEACRLGLTTPDALMDRALALRAGGRQGPRLVAHLLLSRPSDAPGHRSVLETYVARILADGGVPPGLSNHRVRTPEGTFECDVFWPERRVVLEIDGSTHDRVDQALFDEKKSAALAAIGCEVLRTRRKEVLRSPKRLCDRVREALI